MPKKIDGRVPICCPDKPHYVKGLCRQCYNRQHRENNQEKYRDAAIKYVYKRYGMTPLDYQLFFKDQKGLCAICEKPSKHKLVVDHDHETNRIRALLCRECNSALGLMKDDIDRLISAADYVRYHRFYE